MKRLVSLVLVTGIFVLWAPQMGRAQGQRTRAFFNMGFMTKEKVSPNWLTLGAEIALPVETRLSLNPELTLWGSGFTFNNYYVVPGVAVNFRIGRFSLGAGVVKRLWISRFSKDDFSEKIAPKFQVGYLSGRSRIAFVVIPLSAQDYVSFGLSLGMGF